MPTPNFNLNRHRLVPIELPTRRRRVCHVGAVTGSVAVCLFARAIVLIMLAGHDITVDDYVSLTLTRYRRRRLCHIMPSIKPNPSLAPI